MNVRTPPGVAFIVTSVRVVFKRLGAPQAVPTATERLDPVRHPEIVARVVFDEVWCVPSVIMPVPGGVGPVTVASPLHSTVEGAAKQLAEAPD